MLTNLVNVHAYLCSRKYPVSAKTIADELQISIATVYRSINALKDRFGFEVKSSHSGYQAVKAAEFPVIFYGV